LACYIRKTAHAHEKIELKILKYVKKQPFITQNLKTELLQFFLVQKGSTFKENTRF